MTLLYILIGLFAIYLAYSFGTKRNNGQAANPMRDKTDGSSHPNSHMQQENNKRKGGCC